MGHAQDRPACDDTGTLSGFIACLKDQTRFPAGSSAQVCDAAPRVAMPVAGRRVLGFGDRTEHNMQSKGIVIETAAGAVVSAPVSGGVLFCGGWRGYGQLVIVDAGCNVDVLISGVMTVSVASGAHVERSAVIGKMSEFTSPDLPVLYLEVRENGAPVNPER